VRRVPSAFVVGAFQLTATEAASTPAVPPATATRTRTVRRRRARVVIAKRVVEANSLFPPRDVRDSPDLPKNSSVVVTMTTRSMGQFEIAVGDH